MNSTIAPHHVVDLPAARRDVLNFIDLSSWEHRMYGLLEADVTLARQRIRAYQAQTGEKLSITGYLACCLARAVDEDKSVQAYPKGRQQLVLFDDVDVGLMIERHFGRSATRALIGYVVRRANHKTVLQIHQEIRVVQTAPAPPPDGAPAWLALLQYLPGPLLALLNRLFRLAIRRNPASNWVAMAGTVGISAVGMFGHGGGWGLAAPAGHTLCLFVGGIARKPAVVGDRIEPRELLSLTVAFNHDVVDGAPAAHFVSRLVELIESGYGLDDEPSHPPLDSEAAAALIPPVPA